MKSETGSLGAKVADNTAFAVLDTIIRKLGNTVVFVLLVRLLTGSEIAAIGVAGGYLTFLTYLDIAPVRVLLRDYPRFESDRQDRDQLLTGLGLFWLLQTTLIILLCLGLDRVFLMSIELPGLSLLFWALTADFIAVTLQDWIRVVFYVDFQQREATRVGLFVNASRLAVFGLLLLDPSIEFYSWLLIATSAAICVIWTILFQRYFRVRPRWGRSVWRYLIYSLKSYGLWESLNRKTTATLFMVDTVVLSSLGLLGELDSYTIALKFCSMLWLIPMQLESSTQLALANVSTRNRRIQSINSLLKIDVIVSILQLGVILLIGDWLLRLLFGADIPPSTVEYMIVIGVGVTIMNVAFPLIGAINNLCDLRDAFLQVFVPSLLLGVLGYAGLGAVWGTIGVAYGNIVAYAIVVTAALIFLTRRYGFSLSLAGITSAEWALTREILGTLAERWLGRSPWGPGEEEIPREEGGASGAGE